MVTPDVDAQAKEWLDRVDAGRGLSGNWRVEIVQKRYRKDRNGTETECTDLPLRIRRFVPGCPWALVAAVIRELVARAPYTDIVCNGVVFAGKYHPTLTRWERDEQRSVDERRGADGTYTLVQDLVEDSACGDGIALGSQSTCQYEEETEWRWDEPTVDFTLPDCGPGDCSGTPGCQGVTHAIGAVSRNEDGSFNYQIVKRTAKTVHTPEVEIRCASCGVGRMTRESWDNVYGEPGSFRFDCGTPIVPPVCATGRQVTLDVRMNADCTYRVEAAVEYAPAPDSYGWSDGTSCRTRTVAVREGDTRRPDIPEPSVGETVSVALDRRPDCTWNSRIERVAAAPGETFGWTDGTACRPRVNTVYMDWRTRPDVPFVGNGQRLDASISRNQDCTWDARFSVLSAATAFANQEWTTGSLYRTSITNYYKDVANIPTVPAVRKGTTVDASFALSDDCTWSGTSHAVTAKPFMWSWKYGTACASVAANAFRNQTTIPAAATTIPNAGTELSSSVEMGEDGLYSGRYTLSSATPWSTTYNEGSVLHTDRVNVFKDQTSGAPTVPRPIVGTTVAYRIDRDASCAYSGSVMTRTAQKKEYQWTEGTALSTVTVTAGKNQTTIPSIKETSKETSKEKSKETSKEIPLGTVVNIQAGMNEDGTYDWQKSVRTVKPASFGWVEGTSCAPVTVIAKRNTTEPPPSSVSRSSVTNISASLNEDGTYNWQRSVRTIPQGTTISWVDGTKLSLVRTQAFFGLQTVPRVDSPSAGKTISANLSYSRDDCTYSGSVSVSTRSPASMAWTEGSICEPTERKVVWGSPTKPEIMRPQDGQYVQYSVSANNDGTWDYSTTTSRINQAESDSVEWDSEVKGPNSTLKYKHKVVIFRYQTLSTVSSLLNGAEGDVNLSLSQDRFCRYSGQVSSSVLSSWTINNGGGGVYGGIQKGSYSFYLFRQSPDGRLYRKSVTVPTVVYYGRGNEGSRASAMANGITMEGLSLPAGVYPNGKPTYGNKWEEV